MKLIEVTKAFATEDQCLDYLEASRWPEGVRCTTCGNKNVSKITRKVTAKTDNKRARLYQCLEPSLQGPVLCHYGHDLQRITLALG